MKLRWMILPDAVRALPAHSGRTVGNPSLTKLRKDCL